MYGRIEKCFTYFVIAMSYYGVYRLGTMHAVKYLIENINEEGAKNEQ